MAYSPGAGMARLVVVSRVAIPNRNGTDSAGGLAVVLRPILKQNGGIWFGWSGKVVTKSEARVRTVERGHQSYVVTDLSSEDYDEYYNGFANPVLWPIFHYRLDMAEFSRRDFCGYMRVNQHFAAESHKILRPTISSVSTASAFSPHPVSASRDADRGSEP